MNSWPVWVAALWWGSLTTLGFAVVPLLFAYLPSPALAGMLLALLVEFAVAPRILARENLRLWHGVGSAMYLLQWICAAVTFARLIQPDAGGGVGARLG